MAGVNSAMLESAQRYIEVVHERGARNLELERVYRNIQKPGLFLLAYNELYAKHGATTTGTDPEDTIQAMSLNLVQEIVADLERGTYQWKPARRIYIAKPTGGLRPISIPCWKDKLLQGVLRLVFTAYYEPQFSVHSHGFRPNRGCHTALGEIARQWNGTVWFIEGDIQGCFDHIDHHLLLEIIGKQIKDERLVKLLRGMLEAGYLEDWVYQTNYSGTPQGGVLSPMLANIYLNELDRFVEQTLLPKYTVGEAKKRTPHPDYWKACHKARWAEHSGNLEEAQRQRAVMRSLPSFVADAGYRRLRYIRYADDFLLGFIGTKEEATAIKEQISAFLKSLCLNLSEKKTLITHAKTESAAFLGYEISIAVANSRHKDSRRSINGFPMLRIPQAVVREWRMKFMVNGKTVGRKELMNESDYDIVSAYAAEYNGVANYYEMAVNRPVLHDVKGHFTESLVKTLAEKHKCSISVVYAKYQRKPQGGLKHLAARIEREGRAPLVARFGELSLRYHRFARRLSDKKQTRYFRRNQQADRLLAEVCELCGKEGVPLQGHHVRKLSDLQKKYRNRKDPPAWVVKMSEIHRKTLFLCPKCHSAIHTGKYDGKKVE